MHEYGILSLLPPIIAIILAIVTRQVFVSLLFGIWLGWIVLSDFQIFQGSLNALQALVDVFKSSGNTRTIMFCALVGALIIFIQRSGGVEGFIQRVSRFLQRYENKKSGSNVVIVQFLAWLTGLLIFVESSISVLTVGALYRPIFDKLGISREKLAYIADSSSAPSSILIPFNGWGAFIMGLLITEGYQHPFSTMIGALMYNFYPVIALAMVLVVIFTKKDIGPMKKAEYRVRELKQLHREGTHPMISDALTEVEVVKGIKPKAYNMVIPIVLMVALMPIMLAYTGWADALEKLPDGSFGEILFLAIGKGSGSTSVLVAVTATVLFSMIFYGIQGIMKFREMVDLTIKGISEMMPLALLMMTAFAISALCNKEHLDTGNYVASLVQGWLSPGMVPFLLFLVSSFIAFSTGTSWGTFAIMVPIAVSMVHALGGNEYMALAAAIGGGVFGDHCSPISDTTILSSMASATDHVEHVRTQLPYAALSGGLTALLYLIFGMMAG